MRKLPLILLCLPLLFSSCKKEEGCTDPSATNYNIDAESDDGSCNFGIVGIWRADSVIIHVSYEELSITGQSLGFESYFYTSSPENLGISGDLQFTDDGIAIIEFVSNIDTGTYIISGNTFSHFESDGDLGAIFTYSSTKNHLILVRSMSESSYDYDGHEIYTRQETLYLTKQ